MRVILTGPSPNHVRGISGLGAHVGYMEELLQGAGVPHQIFFVDELPKRLALASRAPLLHRGAGWAWGVGRYLSRGLSRTDVIHVNSSLYPRQVLRDAPFVRWAKRRGLPVLLQIHGGRLRYLSRHRILRRLWLDQLRLCDRIAVFPGEQLDELVSAGYGDKCLRVHNLLPIRSPPTRAPSQPSTFLFLGRLVTGKGVHDLIEAWRQVEAADSSARLIVAGDGPQRSALHRRIATLREPQRVETPGFIEGDARAELFHRANVMVVPSRWGEGFPLAFLEGAERQMAPVITDTSAICHVFQRDIEYLSVAAGDQAGLADAMVTLARSGALRDKVALAARAAVAERCGLRSAGMTYLDAYKGLLSGR